MTESTVAHHYCPTEIDEYNENLLTEQEHSKDRLKELGICRSQLSSSTNDDTPSGN